LKISNEFIFALLAHTCEQFKKDAFARMKDLVYIVIQNVDSSANDMYNLIEYECLSLGKSLVDGVPTNVNFQMEFT
jgi:uncharacterized membrane protein